MSRSILVTGASSGIGRAISNRLLESGYSVIGIARDFARYKIEHANFTAHTIDLSDLDRLQDRLSGIANSNPAISGLILCAGQGKFGSLEESSFTQIRSLIDLNLTSQICLVRGFLPFMKRASTGDIILMGSEAALSGGRRGAVYSASKFGLRGFAQALRQECSCSGIRVSIVNPGMVKTDFFNELNFRPGDERDNYILPDDVARMAQAMLEMQAGTVLDEVNMSPQKKVLKFTKPPGAEPRE